MTTPTDTTPAAPEPTPAESPAAPPAPARAWVVDSLRDVLVVAAWFVVAGILGGWIWSVVATPPKVTRVGDSASVPSEELVKQVGMDGWFIVIAVVAGVVSGLVLLAWRRRDPLLTVALVTLGGALASWLMIHVGRALGPSDPIAALRKLPDGAHVSEALKLHAPGAAWTWPIAAAFGALIYLWVLSKPDSDRG
jgi:hypothetical protein